MKNGKRISATVTLVLLAVFVFLTYKLSLLPPKVSVKITTETVAAEGLKKEYRFLFLADSHISLSDARDDEAVIQKERGRTEMFRYNGADSEVYFDAIIGSADQRNEDLIILGGDIVDSAMYASLEHVRNTLDGCKKPYLYYSGNHDFEYGEEYYSEKAFEEYLPRLEILNRKESFRVKEYEDLIVFAADDWRNRLSKEALEAFKEQVAKNKPIMLCIHVPLEPRTGDTALVDICKEVWNPSPEGNSRVTLGPNGCIPDAATQEFLDLVMAKDSPVFLVLAGHIHLYHRDYLNENTLQIVTGAAFEGNAVEVILQPKQDQEGILFE